MSDQRNEAQEIVGLNELIIECVNDVREQNDIAPGADISPDARLFGREGMFESLALVNLITSLEEAIEDKFDVAISLADERAMSQNRSPYRTIAALAEYAAELIAEQR